jgi:hypothetical protein
LTTRRLILGTLILAVAGGVAWVALHPRPRLEGSADEVRHDPGSTTSPSLQAASAPPAVAPADLAAPVDSAPTPRDTSVGAAETYIEGIVRDTETGREVAGLSVKATWRGHGELFFEERGRVSATTDSRGRFRMPWEAHPDHPNLSFDIEKGAWVLARWSIDDERHVEALVGRPFFVQGIVEGDDGRPVVGALIPGTGARETGADGRFSIGPFPEDPAVLNDASQRERFSRMFLARGYEPERIYPYAIAPDKRDDVRVVMQRGVAVGGVVVDTTGRPIPHARVDVRDSILGDNDETDEEGRWQTEVRRGPIRVLARAFSRGALARYEGAVNGDMLDLRLVAEPIVLPEDLRRVTVLGMVVADADDRVRAAFALPAYARVVILDPGPYTRDTLSPDWRKHVGLDHGDSLAIIGSKPVTSVRELVEHVLNGIRRVETHSTRGDTTHGVAHLEGTQSELSDLRRELDSLPR